MSIHHMSRTATTTDSSNNAERIIEADNKQPGPRLPAENIRGTGLGTSAESVVASQELATTLGDRVDDLVRQSKSHGLTIGEAQELIRDHKDSSISPRFRELEKQGRILRGFLGLGRPTKRFPQGAPLYVTRRDEKTRRKVAIYWAPEFAPTPERPANAGRRSPEPATVKATHRELTRRRA